jgi:hypothetical protein
MKRTDLREHYADFRSNWETLTLYQRFEQVIALVLTWLIAVVVGLGATYWLIRDSDIWRSGMARAPL